MKRIMQAVIVNLAVTAVLLVSIELLLRALDIVPDTIVRPAYLNGLLGDYESGIRVRNSFPERYPHIFTTNAQGYRSLHEYDVRSEAVSILCLGDSFTMGWGVDDEKTYPEQLRRLLSEKFPGRTFNVVNGGRLFSSVLDQIDYFRAKGTYTKPQLVVCQTYFNDLPESALPYINGQVGRLTMGRDSRDVSAVLSYFSRTATFNLLMYLKYSLFHQKQVPVLNGQMMTQLSGTDIHGMLVKDLTDEEKRLMGDWDKILDERSVPQLERLWQSQREAILTLRRETEAAGGVFIHMNIPNKYQLEKYRNAYSSVANAMTRDFGVQYLDIGKVFRQTPYAKAEDYYLNNDEHTNEYGNLLIAKTVADSLAMSKSGRLVFMDDGYHNTYQNPVVLTISAGPDGLESQGGGAGSLEFLASPNLAAVECGVECGLIALKGRDSAYPATLHMSVKTQVKIRYLDVVCFPKLVHSPGSAGAVSLKLRNGGTETTLLEYVSRKDGSTDSNENVRMIGYRFPTEVDSFELVMEMRGGGEFLTTNMPGCDPDRKLTIYCYPGQ